MEPGVEEKGPDDLGADTPPASRFERTRARKAALEARAKEIAERAEEERRKHESLDLVYEVVERDTEVAGGILSGALAYRLFIWALPLALVLVAGLGFFAGANSESPDKAASSLGLTGLVSSSVSAAAKGDARWYALIVGIPLLLYVTRGLLRALIGAHRLAWTDLRATAPRPTATATLRVLGLILCIFLVTVLAAAARAHALWLGVVVSLLLVFPYAAIWLLISLQLPHRDAGWRWLIPGALAFGVGIELVQIFTTFILGPYALNKQGTYGALGTAAALLLGLYFVCRVIMGAAVLNATIWERELRAVERGDPPGPLRKLLGTTMERT